MFVMGQLGANFGVNCWNSLLEMQFRASGRGGSRPDCGAVRPYLIQKNEG